MSMLITLASAANSPARRIAAGESPSRRTALHAGIVGRHGIDDSAARHLDGHDAADPFGASRETTPACGIGPAVYTDVTYYPDWIQVMRTGRNRIATLRTRARPEPRGRSMTDEFGGAQRSELGNPDELEDAMTEESRIRIIRVGTGGAA